MLQLNLRRRDLQDLLVQRMLQRGLFQKLRLLIVRCSAASTPLDEDTPSSSPWIFIFQLLQASKSHPRTLSLFIQQFIIHILSLPNALLSSKTSRIAPWLSLILRSLSAQELLQNSALLYHDSEAKLAVFINLLQVVGLSKSLTIDDTVSPVCMHCFQTHLHICRCNLSCRKHLPRL